MTYMCIGPAKAKAVDTDALDARDGPRRHFSGDLSYVSRKDISRIKETYLDLPLFKVNVRVPIFKVCIWRNLALLQHQHSFDQACHTSSALKMPDIRLHRADIDGIIRSSNRCNRLGDSLEFAPVASLGSCAVAFHVACLVEVEVG